MMLPNEGEDVGWQIKRTNNGVGIVTSNDVSLYLSLSHSFSLPLKLDWIWSDKNINKIFLASIIKQGQSGGRELT